MALMARRFGFDHMRFAVFRCSSQKLSASGGPYPAEMLGRAASGAQNNSEPPAVPPLFFAVFVEKNSERGENRIIPIINFRPMLTGDTQLGV
jgi:hypothetical protein